MVNGGKAPFPKFTWLRKPLEKDRNNRIEKNLFIRKYFKE
jgi:hypothetical protein